ncbi:MAG: CoA transferase [Chloroflexi bacterium]|nr:CoA transferase [Chloroflexota bacterium]
MDFGWVAAGPRTSSILADMGAEVIKVESRKRVDALRFGADNVTNDPEKSPFFHSVNRNKLGITVDIANPKGIDLLKRLVKISDVVVENFSPQVMRKLGLHYEALREIKEDIIMTSLPSVGNVGPLSDVVTYGPSLASLSGLDSIIGYDGEKILGMQQPYADINAAFHAAFAVLVALRHRELYGEGQYIELAQIETLLSTMAEAVLEYSMNGRVLGPAGNTSPTMAPHNNYRCEGEDKWISIAVRDHEEWEAFCRAIGEPQWASDERFADTFQRQANRVELDKLITAWTSTKTQYEAMDILQRAGVAAMPCADTEDRFFDQHLAERQVLVELEHPATDLDWIPGLVSRLSETPGSFRSPAPLIGQHNDYVFGELLGLPKDTIAELVDSKVIS